jgi:hypothetical protein
MITLGSRHGYGALLVTACAGVSALASLAASALVRPSSASSPAAEETVTAKAFILVDDNGRVRAKLGMNPSNRNFGLFLFDSAGHKLADFDVDQDKSPELLIYGTDENTKFGLMLHGEHERPMLNLYAESEHSSSHPALSLGVWEIGSQPSPMPRKSNGRGVLRVYDADGAETLREGK